MDLGIVRGYWHLQPHEELPTVPALEASYLAGHFDGEGCIYMRNSGKSYKLNCSVTAAWLPVLEKYQRYFGGSIHPAHAVKKPLNRWSLWGYRIYSPSYHSKSRLSW